MLAFWRWMEWYRRNDFRIPKGCLFCEQNKTPCLEFPWWWRTRKKYNFHHHMHFQAALIETDIYRLLISVDIFLAACTIVQFPITVVRTVILIGFLYHVERNWGPRVHTKKKANEFSFKSCQETTWQYRHRWNMCIRK